jgi:hypothetical protein
MFFGEELGTTVLFGGLLIILAMTAIARGSIPHRKKLNRSDA